MIHLEMRLRCKIRINLICFYFAFTLIRGLSVSELVVKTMARSSLYMNKVFRYKIVYTHKLQDAATAAG
jgi:hypothetical protein